MLFLIIFFSIIIISVIFYFSKNSELAFGITAAAVTLLLAFLIAVPLSNYSIKIKIQQIEQQRTYIENRLSEQLPEYNAISLKIIEINQWIIGMKTSNKNKLFFDIYIPNEIDDVELLK